MTTETSSVPGPDEEEVTERITKITIRSWPKIIFLYPTFIASFIGGVWQSFVGNDVADPAVTSTMQTIGLVFFLVFALNLLVISFEFTRIKTVAILFFIIAVICALLYFSEKFPIFDSLKQALRGMHLEMSTSMYFALSGYFLFIYALVFVNTRWNYWVIRRNEIIHYTGFLGDIKRYPSPNLRMTKSINDVFEFMLLGSGRIALYPQSEREAIVLDNVLNVNRIERTVKKLLSAISVDVSHHYHPAPEEH